MGKRQSLVLITVDCLRADHTGFLGYDRPTTPFLDSIASESIIFQNAIVAGAPTYHSFPAIMASRYPLALGRDLIGLAPGEPTLATVLKDAGYATAGFVAANPYISRRFGYAEDFDTFHDFLDQELPPTTPNGNGTKRTLLNRVLARISHQLGPVGGLYDELYFRYSQRLARQSPCLMEQLRRFPAADEIVDQACEWLNRVSRPFFLWIHFMDPHAPYYPLPSALQAMGYGGADAAHARYLNSYWNRGELPPERAATHRDEIVGLYDAGIRSVDTELARLVGALQDAQCWDNCIFAFTGDHGEEFLEHGGRAHFPPKVTEELVRVPLLIRAPKNRQLRRLKHPFSLIHLAPTLLEAAGVPPPASFAGVSRWRQMEQDCLPDESVITECTHQNPSLADHGRDDRQLSVRGSRYKLVFDFSGSRERLFDLDADPKELTPLPLAAQPDVRRKYLQRARKHISSSWQGRDSDRRLGLTLRNMFLEEESLTGKFSVHG